MRPSARSPPNNSDMIRRFEEEIEVGTWSGALSVQTGSNSKDMAGSSVQKWPNSR